jgi:hypothetical protein
MGRAPVYKPAGILLQPYFGNADSLFPAVKVYVHGPVPQFDRKPGKGGGGFSPGDFRKNGGTQVPFIGGFPENRAAYAADQQAGFPGRQGVEQGQSARFFPANRAGIPGSAGTEGFHPGKEQNTNFQRNIGFIQNFPLIPINDGKK